MLKADEVLKIRSGQWEIDCPDMELRSRAPGGTSFTGSGMIRIGSDKVPMFKLYAAAESAKLLAPQVFGTTPGLVIPDSEYFDLEARDFAGRTWTALRVLPGKDVNWSTSRLIWKGEIDCLTSRSELPVQMKRSALHLHCLSDVKLPWNAQEESNRSIDGIRRSESYRVRAAKLDVAGYDFLFEEIESGLLLTVDCPGPGLLEDLSLRIAEGLQFVLARWITWTVLEMFHESYCDVEIRRAPAEEPTPRLQPPIAFRSVDIDDRVWNLFKRFFQYLIAAPKAGAWKLSELLFSVVDASKSSTYATALALSVAVEGVLRSEFADLCRPSDDFCREVTKLLNSIAASDLQDPAIKNRFVGAVGAMKGLRAQQGLDRLVAVHAVDQLQVDAWRDMRNKFTHGEVHILSSPGAAQEFFDGTLRLTCLLYRLMFAAIGYEGPYTDYGTRGWPIAMHPRIDVREAPPRQSGVEPSSRTDS